MGIRVMLLTEITNLNDIPFNNPIFQLKENGVRGLVSIKNHKITAIRSRSDTPVLHLYPELARLEFPNVEEALLDSEIVVFDKTNPIRSVFYDGIDQRSHSYKGKEAELQYPVTLVFFDALKINGQTLLNKPYNQRYDALINAVGVDMVAKNYTDFNQIWDLVVKHNLEGVVIKNPLGYYELDKRSMNALKFKWYKDASVLVEKTEQNTAGTKVYGKTNINGQEIECECQFGGIDGISIGEVLPIKYLDIVGNRLIQPTKKLTQKVIASG